MPSHPAEVALRIDDWDALRDAARAVRTAVFVVEQQIPLELEQDAMDALCLHAVAFDPHGTPIGTGRLLPDGHIGRMAVLRTGRGQGLGGVILLALIEAARQRGDTEVVLNAQQSAEPFYLRHGFVRDGELFVEAGIVHVCMRRLL